MDERRPQEILGSDGAVISTSQVQGRVGLNQTSWNLLYPPPDRVVLRSLPPDNPHIWEEGRWPGRERPVSHWGLGAANWQPRAAPGKYTVRMTLNDRQYSQPFEVWRDVTLPSSDAELTSSTDLQRKIVTAMNESADKINRIEIMRMQVEDLRKANAGNRALTRRWRPSISGCTTRSCTSCRARKCTATTSGTSKSTSSTSTSSGCWPKSGGSGGDVMGGAGYGPTRAARAVFEDRLGDLAAGRAAFDRLMKDVEAFNKANAGKLPALTDRLVR